MTEAEKKLWWRIRGEELGVAFRRQHPVGPYVLDFYCAPLGLAIELDGHQHGTDAARHADERRTAFLVARGIRVMRFGNHEIFDNLEGVLETIWNTLHVTPTPTLPLAGGRSDGAEVDR
jgi:very-short-patch-repair endonuclease